MSTDRYIKFKTISAHIIVQIMGVFLIIAGLAAIAEEAYRFAMPALLPGLVVVFSHFGIEIDLEKKLLKEYFLIVVFKFGKWRSISEYEYIFVRKVEVRFPGAPTVVKHTMYKVFLKDKEKREGIELVATKDKKAAVEFGKHIAEKLDFELKLDVEYAY